MRAHPPPPAACVFLREHAQKAFLWAVWGRLEAFPPLYLQPSEPWGCGGVRGAAGTGEIADKVQVKECAGAGREAGTEGSHGGGHNIPRGNRLRDEGIARRLLQYLQKKKEKEKRLSIP